MAAIDQTKNLDLEVCWGRGDTDPKIFTIKDSAGVVIDVSGWTFALTVNSKKDPSDQVNEQFTIVGAFITDGTDGKVQFTPALGDTDILPNKYFYDIERKISTASIRTLIKGVARIVQDITKV